MLTTPIVDGTWYLLFNGQLSQSNERTLKQNEFGQFLCPRCGNPARNSGNEFICADTYQDCGHVSRGEPGVQVWLVPTDPAEVVAELREREETAYWRHVRTQDDYHRGEESAFDEAADLVAEKLGVES